MADKSPRQNLTKKTGKSLKEKRSLKQAKAQEAGRGETVPATAKGR